MAEETNNTYQKEFDLNLIHQIKNPKEILRVGYEIDNMILFTIIIPRILFPIKKKEKNVRKSKR